MAFTKLPKLFTPGYSASEKPIIPVEIDWSNPLTKGLVSALLFNNNYYDLVDNYHPASISGAPEIKPSGGIISLVTNGTDWIRMRDKFVSPDYATRGCTFAAGILTATSQTSKYFITETNNVAINNLVGLNISNDKASFFLRDNNNDGSNVIGTTTITDGVHHNIVGLHDPVAKKTRIYTDGIEENSATKTGTTPTVPNTAQLVSIRKAGSHTPDASFDYQYKWNRTLSHEEVSLLNLDPYLIFKPAIPQYAYLAETTGTTGTGTPQATTATTAASATRKITGTSSSIATTATTAASGLRLITGTGTPQSDTATTTASGARNITGEATPQADNATTVSTGTRTITGESAAQAGTATTSASGTVGNAVSGTGTPQAETSTASGTGLRLIHGTGTVQADTATAAGEGTNSGVVVITGNGTPQAEPATTAASGLRLITGTGTPQADTATATATGLRLITGTGTVQADTATAIGAETYPTVHPKRIYTLEAENRTYTLEAEDRIYDVA